MDGASKDSGAFGGCDNGTEIGNGYADRADPAGFRSRDAKSGGVGLSARGRGSVNMTPLPSFDWIGTAGIIIDVHVSGMVAE